MSARVSILMPVYNGGEVLRLALRNILAQSYKDYEIIISDDGSTDNTSEIVHSFTDPRIRFARNERNLGYPGNLEVCRQTARGDILFLMGQDDILCRDAILKTIGAFDLAQDVGAVTRPYFWFDKNINVPVRATVELNPAQDEVIRITDDYARIASIFYTVGQLTGLAYRTAFMDVPFHKDIFPCHIYPFASILKKHPVVFLKDFTVAVRIQTSQSRKVSTIYDKSPLQSWVEMYRTIFHEPEFRQLRDKLVSEHAATNYLGLLQIRNYSRFRNLLREIGLLIAYRPRNIFNPAFWFFALGTATMPPCLLIPLVDWYKNHIHSKRCPSIQFDYDIA